jgi:hypothetical protein
MFHRIHAPVRLWTPAATPLASAAATSRCVPTLDISVPFAGNVIGPFGRPL